MTLYYSKTRDTRDEGEASSSRLQARRNKPKRLACAVASVRAGIRDGGEEGAYALRRLHGGLRGLFLSSPLVLGSRFENQLWIGVS